MPKLAAIKIRGQLAAALIYPKQSCKSYLWVLKPPSFATSTKHLKEVADRATQRMIFTAFIAIKNICIADKNP